MRNINHTDESPPTRTGSRADTGGTSEPLARLMSRAERYNDALVDIVILHRPAVGYPPEDPHCAICLGDGGSRLRHPCETRQLAETALSKENRA